MLKILDSNNHKHFCFTLYAFKCENDFENVSEINIKFKLWTHLKNYLVVLFVLENITHTQMHYDEYYSDIHYTVFSALCIHFLLGIFMG